METIALLPIFLALGWLISKNISTEYKSDYNQIDDKNWIVNGEFVSLEKDTPALRFQQEMEDNKHYQEFENNKLSTDRKRIFDNYMKVTEAIHRYPDLLEDCVTKENLLAITKEYDRYVYMCKKLKEELYVLTKEQFLIMSEKPIYCCVINIINPLRNAFIYAIYNEKTARYANGNITELMEAEFKTKWYG